MARNIYLVRVINGEDSWRISWSVAVQGLPDNGCEADMLWYQAHAYRTIHRLAKDDSNLTVRTQGDRLEAHEAGKRIVWFKLDSRGEPSTFGFHDDDQGSLCGPWTVIKNNIRHPSWSATQTADGVQRLKHWRSTCRSTTRCSPGQAKRRQNRDLPVR